MYAQVIPTICRSMELARYDSACRYAGMLVKAEEFFLGEGLMNHSVIPK